MKIYLGTKNNSKLEALRETIEDYEFLRGNEVIAIKSNSEVSEQPMSLDETIKGAINRAKNCFDESSLSFGIESGLMKVPNTKTGFMDFTACAIFDGKQIHLGLSSAFEYPLKITKLLLEGFDASEAYKKLGLTEHEKIGEVGGIIGDLTKGRIKRKDYTKHAIQMALIHLENPDLY